MKPYKLLYSILILASSGVSAEVLDAAAGGFTVQHQVSVPATRGAAWDAFTAHVGDWWNDDHSFSGDAANMYIDAVPLGCFCEKLGEGAGLVHLQVTFANPGALLRLTGGLGPLGLLGTSGNMTVEFSEDAENAGHTVVTLQYAVGGYRSGGLDALAAPVDGVLGEQLAGFAAYVTAAAAP